MNPIVTDSDLRWPLTSFDKPHQACDFLTRLNGALPVYSSTVRKLYTEYRATVVHEADPVLLIQPDMTQYAAIFSYIPLESLVRTSVFIYADNEGLCLSGVLKSNESRKAFRLKDGFFQLFSGAFIDEAFLPVMTYGDLRTLTHSTKPILQLHGLRLEALSSLSEFQINDIVSTIKKNLVDRLA